MRLPYVLTNLQPINGIGNFKISDAAKIIGKSEQFVRIGLQRNILPFGTAIKMSSVWTYHISPKLLGDYVGTEVVNNFVLSENQTKGAIK